MSLRDEILAISDPALELQAVAVPGWDVEVFVRGWTGTERDRFEIEFGDLEKQRENLRAKVVCRCVLDADGKRIFEDGDAPALGQKSAAALDFLFTKIMSLSGLTRAAQDEAKKN